jgi:hypothetical protein
MSSYTVIAEVSKALQSILWEEFNADDVIRPIVGAQAAIVFRNPTEAARDAANRLSLWLYQITENEFVKHQPPLRARSRELQARSEDDPRQHRIDQFPPLALNLFYLVTPLAPSGESDHLLLGKSMQVLYDNATLLLRNTDGDVFEELRIVFCRLTLEELTRIWEALREPYRLSICYQVRVTRIDSLREETNARVIERTGAFMRQPGPVAE